MGLILKYVEKTKAGSWQYRRRVPKAVSSVITKREFKQKLGETEREASIAWARCHAKVEREIAAAQKRIADGLAVEQGSATDREIYLEAKRRVAGLIASGASLEELAHTADTLAAAYPEDPETYTPVGVSRVDEFAINLMRLGEKRYAAPEPTLGDALQFYLKERRGDDSERSLKKLQENATRVVGHVKAALTRDPIVTSLTRDDAREVRDYMLDRIKPNGKRIAPSSVSRDLNGLNAVINFAALEMPLPATFRNPFSALQIAGASRANGAGSGLDSDKREPLPPAILEKARQRVLEHANVELSLIWRILEGTGCRLAEVSGLRVEDLETTAALPRMRVHWHEERRVKTKTSMRSVPLVSDALEAAKEALKLSRTGIMLFPTYGRDGGPTAASAALMRHVRAVTEDPKHVVHSLRHNMKDRLMLAEVPSIDQNLILGHALGGVGDRVYGGDLAKLRVTTRAMKRAFQVAEPDKD